MKLVLFGYFNNKINLCIVIDCNYYEISYFKREEKVVVHYGPVWEIEPGCYL